ncbi:MAG TPA: hypothetical protein VNJ52_11885 [Patescibacteria group bacterium]|nr:hypothetical protein [Patescibacteria group bacterium]
MPKLKTACLLAVVLSLIAVPAVRAQSSNLAARLPADTLLYLYWRGAGSLTPGSRNALVSLWNDPGFQPARQLILEGLVDAAARNPRLSQIPQKDIEALLADPAVFGIRLAARAGSAHAKPGLVAHGFLVMRATGTAGRDLRADLKSGPHGSTNLRFTRSGLLLASDDPATLDELAGRFGASGTSTSKALSTLAAYREARAEIAGQPAVEFFLRVPEVSSLGPRTTPNFNTGAFLQSLHLERVHLLCGSIDLSHPAALVHLAILGDTSPGSLFDLFGANAASFPTLAAAPVDASISVYRFDIGAVLSLLTNAFSAALGPQQSARLRIISALLAGTVVPALGGEYATIWPHLSSGKEDSLLALTVNPEAAGKLFSTTLAPFVKPAGEEGGIRYFRPSAAGKNGAANGKEQPALLALTPNLLLVSSDESLVRSRARAVTAATPPPGLAGTAGFRAARAELPAELSGLSYFDLQAFDWTEWIRKMAADMAKNKKNPHAGERARALQKWADGEGGAVLSRHLHLVVAGAWKNDQGMHWRGQIQ